MTQNFGMTQRHFELVKNHVKKQFLKRKYGITIDKYNQMVLAQNNKCACCGQEEKLINKYTNQIQRLSVDHNHVTNKIRGLVCARCNRFVIPAAELYPEILSLAVQYLQSYNGGN